MNKINRSASVISSCLVLVIMQSFWFSSLGEGQQKTSRSDSAVEHLKGAQLKALIAVANELSNKKIDIGNFNFYIRDIGDSFEVYPKLEDRKLNVEFPGGYIYKVSKSTFAVTSKTKESAYSPPPGFN